MKGLRVSILKDADIGDCTNGGVTSKATSAVLFAEGMDGYITMEEAKESGEVCLILVKRTFGDGTVYYHAEPLDGRKAGMVGPMAGGNFVYTSDSRFRKICQYPISVHDRFETPEQYEALSR